MNGVNTRIAGAYRTQKLILQSPAGDEENRIPDIIALRQAIYRIPATRDAIDHVLILQDPEARELNLIKEEQWAAIQAPPWSWPPARTTVST